MLTKITKDYDRVPRPGLTYVTLRNFICRRNCHWLTLPSLGNTPEYY